MIVSSFRVLLSNILYVVGGLFYRAAESLNPSDYEEQEGCGDPICGDRC